MLARLKRADELTGDNMRTHDFDDKRSTSSTSSQRRKNVQLRKLLDGIKESNSAYKPLRISPGNRSEVTEMTEKVQFRKDTRVIDPPMNKISDLNVMGFDLSEL